MLSVITLADMTHATHDATSKLGTSIFLTAFQCALKREDGSVMVVEVPLAFDICPSAKAWAEAKDVMDARYSDLAGGLNGSMYNCASLTSGNSPVATSDEVGKSARYSVVNLLSR